MHFMHHDKHEGTQCPGSYGRIGWLVLVSVAEGVTVLQSWRNGITRAWRWRWLKVVWGAQSGLDSDRFYDFHGG